MRYRFLFVFLLLLTACSADKVANAGVPFDAKEITSFKQPWAISFLPDGRLLVTEKAGRLYLVSQNGTKSKPVRGVPKVVYGGQGGLGDVVPHPKFASNRLVYISYVEAGRSRFTLYPASRNFAFDAPNHGVCAMPAYNREK